MPEKKETKPILFSFWSTEYSGLVSDTKPISAKSLILLISSLVKTRHPFRSLALSLTFPDKHHRFNVIGATPTTAAASFKEYFISKQNPRLAVNPYQPVSFVFVYNLKYLVMSSANGLTRYGDIMDVFQKNKRSEIMRKITSKDTVPEIKIRSALHRLGYRFKLHDKVLPGTPDIVLPKYKTVIQIRGCFWHGHDCQRGRIPSSNIQYWEQKLRRNKERDDQNDSKLLNAGWRVIIVWGCSCVKASILKEEIVRINSLLGNRGTIGVRS
jgi:DNA mismatch endonuclease (patch repair protein)